MRSKPFLQPVGFPRHAPPTRHHRAEVCAVVLVNQGCSLRNETQRDCAKSGWLVVRIAPFQRREQDTSGAAAYGLTIKEIAASFEVSPGTFDRWRKRYPTINKAIMDGRARPHQDALRKIKGQTGSYRRYLDFEELQLLAAHAARGANVDQIGEAIGIDRHVLGQLIRDDHETAHAYRLGRAQEESALVSALYQRAMDLNNPGGTTAAIFLLKCHHDYRDGHGPQANVSIEMTPEEAAHKIHLTLQAMDRADGLTNESLESVECASYD